MMNTDKTPSAAQAQDPEQVDLLHLLAGLLAHWKAIAGVTLLTTLVAVVWALFTTPVWQADAMVQVEQKQGSELLSSLSQMLPDEAPKTEPEQQLLQSRMILGKTVRDLGLQTVVEQQYFPLSGRGWARLTGRTPGRLSVAVSALPDDGDGHRVVTLTALGGNTFTVDGPGLHLTGVAGKLLSAPGLSLQVTALEAAPGTRFRVTRLTQAQATAALAKRFTVAEKGKSSGMLGLSLTGDDPVEIARTLDRIADNYLQQNISRQSARDAKSLAFLQQKLPEVRQALDEAEDRLNAYRKKRDSVDLTLEAKSVLEQTVNTDNQLNALTFREAEISQLYKKDHPAYQALLEKRHTLEQEKAKLNNRISAMPGTQQEVLRLSREVESGRAVYMQLLSRQQELNIARSSATGYVRIIDPALTQPAPVKPTRGLIILLGGMLGLVLSAGTVTALTALRQGIASAAELEEQEISVYATVPQSVWLAARTRLRGLGRRHVSRHKTRGVPLLAVDNPADLAVEAIRGLRTSLHFAMLESGGKVLMITGATPDSGKTFISTNLAAVMAQSGMRVLYIDADMRRGYAHHMLGLDNEAGLSEVLAGVCPAQDVMRPAAKGGFDVLTRGTAPPNPSELLMHARLAGLLTQAVRDYDMVIVDTPPVLAVTDAAIAGRTAGLTLLVARYGLNTVREITLSKARLARAGVTVTGAVLNGIEKRAGDAYRYGYAEYGYRYDNGNE